MSRRCRRCAAAGRERLMRDELRHLGELEEGTPFRIPGTGRTSVLLSSGVGRCEIRDPEPAEEVEFQTAEGTWVRFERGGSSTRTVAPTTSVEPLR